MTSLGRRAPAPPDHFSQRVMAHDEIARISGQHSGLFAAKSASALRTQRQVGVREIIDCGDALIDASSRYAVPRLMRDSLPASIRLDVSAIIRTGR